MTSSESKRHVLVLNHFAVPKDGPGGTRHVELFGRLQHWEYILIAANRNLFTRERQHGVASLVTVPTIPYRSNGLSRILNWASYGVGAAIRGLVAHRPDVVYASSPHLLAGLAGLLIARARRTRFVLEVRDLWPDVLVAMGRLQKSSLLCRFLRRLELLLYRASDRIVVLASGSRDAIAAMGIPIDKIVFIPNGAELSDFVLPASHTELRDRYGFHGLTFVYAGAHGPANGLGLLLDAADRIGSAHPEVTIVLVGDGPSKPMLCEWAHRAELSNVRFMDPIPKSDIPALLGAADVGVHVLADVPLFRYGVSPNKLFDYMAAGLPVITNCPGEVAEIVNQAQSGVAVEPDGIETAIITMATATPEQRKRWATAGQRYMEATHSRQQLANRLETLLDNIASPTRRNRT